MICLKGRQDRIVSKFEFINLGKNFDLKIFPMKGIVPGKGQVIIDITYSPMSKTTAFSEIELQLSQFDFTPIISKIMGAGKGVDSRRPGQAILNRRPFSRGSKLKSIDDFRRES